LEELGFSKHDFLDLTTGDFLALAQYAFNAGVDADEDTLRDLLRWLQREYGRRRVILDQQPTNGNRSQAREQSGRLLGLIDVAQWALKRAPAVSRIPAVEPDSWAARLLELMNERRGLDNSKLAAELGIGKDAVSRAGRELIQKGLAVNRKMGRQSHWETTPRGRKTLTLLAEAAARALAGKPKAIESARSEVLREVLGNRAGVKVEDLAASTGRAAYALETAIRGLDREGVVASRQGVITVDGKRSCAIGVTVAPDRVFGIVSSLTAENLADYASEALPADATPNTVISTIAKVAGSLAARVPRSLSIVGLGVAVAGLVQTESEGRVIYASKLPQLASHRLEAELAKIVKLPTLALNNANALAVFERWFGAGRNVEDFATICISGTGVGGGLIVRGRLVHGGYGVAGEIGHVSVAWEGDESLPTCRCGNSGCLECLVSIKALRDRLGLPQQEDGAPLSLSDVDFGNLRDPQNKAVQVLTSAGRGLGQALAMLRTVADPARLVLYGPEELVLKDKFESAELFLHSLIEAGDMNTCGFLRGAPGYGFDNVLEPRDFQRVEDILSLQATGAAAAVVGHFAFQTKRTWRIMTSGEMLQDLHVGRQFSN
jgi:predicted NBD/HSP70 family sugar kinase/predicted ArsR family transcriptional regulator